MKKRFIFRSCLSLIVIAVLGFNAIAAKPAAAAYVKGVVTQSNKPVRSVWVIVSQSGTEKGRALTGDDGKYYIGNLTAGTYDIAVFQGKQQIYSSQINLPQDTLFNIDITPPARPRTRR